MLLGPFIDDDDGALFPLPRLKSFFREGADW